MSDKPLFIPLKREFFEAFARGEKTEEFRVYGPRWNTDTCRVGRPVTLSMGYGKKHRIHGVVSGFRLEWYPGKLPGWNECYGSKPDAVAACIKIEVINGH